MALKLYIDTQCSLSSTRPMYLLYGFIDNLIDEFGQVYCFQIKFTIHQKQKISPINIMNILDQYEFYSVHECTTTFKKHFQNADIFSISDQKLVILNYVQLKRVDGLQNVKYLGFKDGFWICQWECNLSYYQSKIGYVMYKYKLEFKTMDKNFIEDVKYYTIIPKFLAGDNIQIINEELIKI